MSDQTFPYLDGHCKTHGRPDQYHNLCPGEYVSPYGVRRVCSCPNHQPKESAE
jgi:hypothetical protein